MGSSVLSCLVSCALEEPWVVYLVYPCIPYDATFGSCVLGSGCLQPPLGCWPLHSGGGGADSKTSNPFPKSPRPAADLWQCETYPVAWRTDILLHFYASLVIGKC